MNTVRIWFSKRGEASYISLLDLQRVMGRAIKRSGVPAWYTQGFNPHIYLTFACPLPLGQESLKAKQQHLLHSVHSRKIRVNYHDSSTSFLEAVFAKGDRRLAPVMVAAYRKGCYLDSWSDCFHYDRWMETFREFGIDTAFYANRFIGLDEITPWSHLDYGVSHEFLVREYKKALEAKTTRPCNRQCSGCGANLLLGGPCFEYSQDLVQ